MNLSELPQKRGTIVESFIAIEGFIGAIISLHFLHKLDTDFIIRVLGNEQATFGFRRNILKQIIKDSQENKKELENLATLNRIRNLFGHAIGQAKGREAPTSFEDPKNPGKTLDAQKQFDRFIELRNPTIKWLQDIFIEKGGTLEKGSAQD